MRILTKSAKGEYVEQFVTRDALYDILKGAADEDGHIGQEIVVFQDCAVKALDDGSIEWVMSDYEVDRDAERIDSSGWDLKNFKKNPVVLWSHDYYTPAIGKVISPRVKDSKLVGRVKFSSKEVDPFAAMIEGKVREGTISSGSVGYRSIRIEIVDDKKEPAGLIFREQELYEFSIVNIPSNTNATVQREAAPEEMKDLKLRITWLEKILKDDGQPSYIADLLKDKGGETSPPPDDETSHLMDLFASDESDKTEIQDLLEAKT